MLDLSERELELPKSTIAKLLKIAVEDKKIISLGPGEPDFKASRPIVQFTKQFANKCNHYSPPGGRKELKEAIIKKLKKDNKIYAKPENIVVTCGSQEALLLASMCTLDVNDKVILPNPSFMGYLPMFELLNVKPISVKLKEENKFEIDPDDVKKKISKKTEVLLLNTPANPTGNVIRKKILEEIADIAVDNNLYIFCDEAYEKIVYDAKHISIGSLNGMKDYVVTLQTFSKSYAMCGYRLGYAVAPANLAKAMTKIHIYSTLSAPTISQMVGAKALSLSSKYINKMVKEYRRRRDLLVNGLNDLGLNTVKTEGAFYGFANISKYSKNSWNFAKKLLDKAKVAVVPGSDFGCYGEGYIRCSYATDYELIKRALVRMEKFLK